MQSMPTDVGCLCLALVIYAHNRLPVIFSFIFNRAKGGGVGHLFTVVIITNRPKIQHKYDKFGIDWTWTYWAHVRTHWRTHIPAKACLRSEIHHTVCIQVCVCAPLRLNCIFFASLPISIKKFLPSLLFAACFISFQMNKINRFKVNI